MQLPTTTHPSLVGKLNQRQVLRVIESRGPLSRAEVGRETGLSAPTVSKAVALLLEAGLLEESSADTNEPARGRPAPRLRLATNTAQVVGIAVDAGHCEVVSAGLDGALHDDIRSIRTPATYPELLQSLEIALREVMNKPGIRTLGIGLSLPGLVDYRRNCGVLSPNVPITNSRTPAADLAAQLGVTCIFLQETHALCLAERYYGLAQGMDDFALIDVGAGVGMGIMSGGRLLKGQSGLAGEIGHITAVAEGGRKCGCGNTGCLETVASDSALAWHASQKLGRAVSVDEVIELAISGSIDLRAELLEVAGFVGIGVAAAINLFNPATVFIHTPLFEIDPSLFELVVDKARERALPPSFADCRIVRAKGSKRQGAIAGIIQHLADSIVPVVSPVGNSSLIGANAVVKNG